MMAIQFYVMVLEQNYTYLLLLSTCSSLLCCTIPAAILVSVIKEDDLENVGMLRTVLSVFQLTVDVAVWTADSFIRTIPIIYLLVHSFTVGIILLSFITVMSMMYIVYTLDVRCNWGNEHGIVMGWTLTFSSIYKLYSVLYQDSVLRVTTYPYSQTEVFVRVSIAITIAFYLYFQDVVDKWQLGVFIPLTIFTCVMQVRFFGATVGKDNYPSVSFLFVPTSAGTERESHTDVETHGVVEMQIDEGEIEKYNKNAIKPEKESFSVESANV